MISVFGPLALEVVTVSMTITPLNSARGEVSAGVVGFRSMSQCTHKFIQIHLPLTVAAPNRAHVVPSHAADVDLQNNLQMPTNPVADSQMGSRHLEMCEWPGLG